ncbi:MAG: SAM hydrolase/SAM-dependent halogenase family protein [Cyclobacteriaceae bacterium]
MAIITLITDSGVRDHYVASVRAKILSVNPGLRIEDISHMIDEGDIPQAAFVLRSVFRDFPKGTVHLIGVDAVAASEEGYIAAAIEDHFFVGPDNGIFALLSEKPVINPVGLNSPAAIRTTFPERDILAPAAAKLASGVPLPDLGRLLPGARRLTDRLLKVTPQSILGYVLYVDGHGNLITNISREAFEKVFGGRSFSVKFGRERADRIQTYYHQSEPGDCFALFNSLGLLEVGIYRGNGSRLLGLEADSPVNILFGS